MSWVSCSSLTVWCLAGGWWYLPARGRERRRQRERLQLRAHSLDQQWSKTSLSPFFLFWIILCFMIKPTENGLWNMSVVKSVLKEFLVFSAGVWRSGWNHRSVHSANGLICPRSPGAQVLSGVSWGKQRGTHDSLYSLFCDLFNLLYFCQQLRLSHLPLSYLLSDRKWRSYWWGRRGRSPLLFPILFQLAKIFQENSYWATSLAENHGEQKVFDHSL